jgi:hypothetical protein
MYSKIHWMAVARFYHALEGIHKAQCLQYPKKATGLEIRMVINFGTPKVQIKRIINSCQEYHSLLSAPHLPLSVMNSL